MSGQVLSGELVLAANQRTREEVYWLEKMSGEVATVAFPTDHSAFRKGERTTEGLPFELTGTLYEKISVLSKGSDHTLHIILTATLNLLLAKYTGERDFVVGTPIYRPKTDGQFLNTVLPLRTQIQAGNSFRDLLLQVRSTMLEAVEHQEYPIEVLLTKLNRPHLYEVSLVMENIQSPQHLDRLPAALNFVFTHRNGVVEATVEYNNSRYHEESVKRIVSHFITLLEKVLSNINADLTTLSLLSQSEVEALVVTYNATTTEYPADKTVAQLFEQQVENNFANLAVAAGDVSLTYQELNAKANRLARVLQSHGVCADSLVALIVENSADTIVGMLAVLKAGGAYVPIDPDNPVERKKFLLEDSQAVVILTQKHLLATQAVLFEAVESERLLLIDDLDMYADQDETNLAPVAGPSNLAYVIYTSGTTGKPKGVLIENQNAVNYLMFAAKHYVQGEKVDFPMFTSIAFDLTITSIFTPLLTGNTVIVYQDEHKERLLERVLEENRVGVVKATPSHLKLIKHRDWSNSSVKRLVVGGEDLKTELAREVIAAFGGNVEIYNEYGPTETVVGCMIHHYDESSDKRDSVPIGLPADNTDIFVLDADRNPVPVGVVGEIFIGGDGVARGYRNRHELTAERFITLPQGRVYRSGDLAKFLPSGQLEYMGRADNQVKINGYRIELGEIETQLLHLHEKYTPKDAVFHDITQQAYPEGVTYCTRCVLPSNYPKITFDEHGVCSVCRAYETYQPYTEKYFKTMDDFRKLVDANKGTDYDVLLLFSGGKDSTYVLYRLVNMGYKVLTFTFDNGFISEEAFTNIKNITKKLDVDHRVLTADQIKSVFVKSLKTYSNVCNGCWNALNGLGAQLAEETGCKVIISGLSRGQIFDMRLWGLFQLGIFDEQEIEEKLLLFRKGFHSRDNIFSKTLDVDLDCGFVETLHFVDFFRYDNTPTHQIREYLYEQGWVPPKDTGFCSSNCRINDIGIYVHLMNEGYHNYAAPSSWDIRFGIISREEGMQEITYKADANHVERVLKYIGYFQAPKIDDVVVATIRDSSGQEKLCAYVVAKDELEADWLREALAVELPWYMVPTYFVQLPSLPLTPNGKVDTKALPLPFVTAAANVEYVTPSNDVEVHIRKIWASVLSIDEGKIGVNDRFFDLGGNSYNMVQVNIRVNETFSKSIPVVKMYNYPTIHSLAEYLCSEEGIEVQELSDEQLEIMDDSLGLFGEVLHD
ncbi:non-ribosomal peptide synthetase [Brevibacillus sp. DP1.3A]|uniref:non-ribosomal peptide synthetase n=1 Tax=Brevibacillus sp. DP1.3A TaxID=2738867 RepID=UPI00156B470C|nr:non-ribosomal peptide synthetase [Brevibacillus sp. DP1.3A]UED72198.1 amino acid adenylation domain-containing protein [Brevibacillus sp. DP1.3A]